MTNVHVVHGFGVMLDVQAQRKLERYFMNQFRNASSKSKLRESVWFTDNPKEFFLHDFLEEQYDGVLEVSSHADMKPSSETIFLSTVSTTTQTYDPNGSMPVMSTANLTKQEKEALKFFEEHTKAVPGWFVLHSLF